MFLRLGVTDFNQDVQIIVRIPNIINTRLPLYLSGCGFILFARFHEPFMNHLSLRFSLVACALLLTTGCTDQEPRLSVDAAEPTTSLIEDVMNTERAFAKSMTNRDLDAFRSFLAEDVVFLTDDGALRGRENVAAAWSAYFESDSAPFSWQPGRAEVLESGDLALSTGPVLDSDGVCIGTFTSIWRRTDDDSWKIVFDRGSSSCDET